METLNSAQVKELFEQEAILIGREDAVPLYRAEELFGTQAVLETLSDDIVKSAKGAGRQANRFGIADGCSVGYLTYRGFCTAASYHNVSLICSQREEVIA